MHSGFTTHDRQIGRYCECHSVNVFIVRYKEFFDGNLYKKYILNPLKQIVF